TGTSAVYGGDSLSPPATWCILFSGNGTALGATGIGNATMNGSPVAITSPSWGSTDEKGNPRATIPQFDFAEAALNLTKLGVFSGCPGFGSVYASTRSSTAYKADLKDVGGPINLPVDCKGKISI